MPAVAAVRDKRKKTKKENIGHRGGVESQTREERLSGCTRPSPSIRLPPSRSFSMARTLPQCGVLRLTLLFAALVVVVQVVVLVRFSSSYDDVDNSKGAIGAPNGETRTSIPAVVSRTSDRVTEVSCVETTRREKDLFT